MVDVLSPKPLSSAPTDILNAHTFDSINTFISDAGNTSLNGEQKQRAVTINITGCKEGLGIRIVDAINVLKQACGIFVKEVIAGSLAEKDGQLQVGDQLLEVNGMNLIGVSREDCRKIMERCTATNHLKLLVARDHQSREDFHRLSISLGNVINPSGMHHIDFNAMAPELTAEQIADNYRFSTITTMTNDTARKSNGSTISSTSLTHVSDISDEPRVTQKADATGNSQLQASVKDTTVGQISTTDVVLEVPSDSNENHPPSLPISPLPRKSSSDDDDSSPPPLPSSEPPALDDDNFNSKQSELLMPKKRIPTNAEAMVVAAGGSIAALAATNKKHLTGDSEIIGVVTITMQSALGITICGGTNKPEGPGIYIDKVIYGLDVANDGTLRPGDRLISINGETMEGVTKERAMRILTQLKLKDKEYQIVYGRKDNQMPHTASTMETPARKFQPVTPSTIGQPTVMYNSSIFDVAVDSTVSIPSTSTIVPNDTTTFTSLTSKLEAAKVVLAPTSTPPPNDDDDNCWQGRDESDHGVVMRGQTTKQESYKRLTMDPRKKVGFDKLIMAMEYMGRKVSESDQQKMRQSLGIAPGGKVAFQDFADLIKEMFKFKLDMSMMVPTLMGNTERKDSMEIPPLRKSSLGLTSSDQLHHSQKEDSPKRGSHDQEAELEKMRQLLHQEGQRREEECLRQQQQQQQLEQQLQQQQQQQLLMRQDAINHQALLKLQAALQEKDQHCKLLESEIERLKRQAEANETEARNYRRQLEQRNLLLSERSKLPRDVEELRRRLAVIDCELRKEKNTCRRYQVTTERLIQIAETVQEALVGGSNKSVSVFYHPRGTPARRGDPVTGNPRPPHYLSNNARYTNESLSQEVQETVKAVKNMLNHQPMPHGWEECSTDDGKKFYIDHQNEVTTWVNPITRVYTGANKSSRTSSRTSSRATNHISITTPPRQ